MIERRHIQKLGAALSRRDWQATEAAYNELRDEFDRPLASPSAEAAQPVAEPVEWLWFGEAGGEQHISFGRWQNHKSQYRYKYADIQATEHDHHAQPQGELREGMAQALAIINKHISMQAKGVCCDNCWCQALRYAREEIAALAGRTAG
jgi:hypothetical protein